MLQPLNDGQIHSNRPTLDGAEAEYRNSSEHARPGAATGSDRPPHDDEGTESRDSSQRAHKEAAQGSHRPTKEKMFPDLEEVGLRVQGGLQLHGLKEEDVGSHRHVRESTSLCRIGAISPNVWSQARESQPAGPTSPEAGLSHSVERRMAYQLTADAIANAQQAVSQQDKDPQDNLIPYHTDRGEVFRPEIRRVSAISPVSPSRHSNRGEAVRQPNRLLSGASPVSASSFSDRGQAAWQTHPFAGALSPMTFYEYSHPSPIGRISSDPLDKDFGDDDSSSASGMQSPRTPQLR